MSWTAQQQQMLKAMGLRVWTPATALPVASIADAAVETELGVELGHELELEATPPAATTPALAATPPSPEARRLRPPLPMLTPAFAPELPEPATAALAAASAVTQIAGLSAMDWPALRAAVAACNACALCEGRQQTVFGTGHPLAHWMVVGEAPGEQEDAEGLAFVGPAGQLLDRMLAALKLSRAEDGAAEPSQRVYVTNALKCRPRNRNPTPAEMAQCEPFLQRQIELLRPRIILAMGVVAVKALLRSDEPLGRLRGQVYRYRGVPLVVTYHPTYLLRQPLEKAKAWADLCLAADTVALPSSNFSTPIRG